MKEQQLSNQTLIVLRKHFAVETEVWDITGKSRIDAVVTCKDSGAVFGIEMKHSDKRRGEELGEIIKQCIRYSKTEFKTTNGYQRIPIFLAPAPSATTKSLT